MKLKKYIISAILCILPLIAAAQDLGTTYFMHNSINNYKYNPAFMGEYSYIQFPFLGEMNFGFASNLGVKNFFMPNKNGTEIDTFLSPNVNEAQFNKGFKKNNLFAYSANISLMGFGVKRQNYFWAVDLSFNGMAVAKVPKPYFTALKKGILDSNNSYPDIVLSSMNYIQLAFNYSRRYKEDWTFGVSAKLLKGIGYFESHIFNVKAISNEHEIVIGATANVKSAVIGYNMHKKFKEEYDYIVSRNNNKGLHKHNSDFSQGLGAYGGWGGAIDLGFVYDAHKFIDGLVISGAVLDLGAINYKTVGSAKVKQYYTFKGFDNISLLDDKKGIDGPKINIDSLFIYGTTLGTSTSTTMLGAKINLSAEYRLPMYKPVKFGVLYTNYIKNNLYYGAIRANVNYAIAKWFDVSVSASYGSFSGSYGFGVNMHPKGINLLLGAELPFSRFAKTPPQAPPIALGPTNLRAFFGLGFTFGGGKK